MQQEQLCQRAPRCARIVLAPLSPSLARRLDDRASGGRPDQGAECLCLKGDAVPHCFVGNSRQLDVLTDTRAADRVLEGNGKGLRPHACPETPRVTYLMW